jgi:hypothetical protein
MMYPEAQEHWYVPVPATYEKYIFGSGHFWHFEESA